MSYQRPPKVGTRVRFQPSQPSFALYQNPPQIGEEGSVTAISTGREKVRFMPGPGGGLLYVKWDHSGHQGVSLYDVQPAGKGSRAPSARDAESPAALAHRKLIGEKMHHWHASAGDPIYAVGSYYVSGKPYPNRETTERALSSVDALIVNAYQRGTGGDVRELKEIRKYLDAELKGDSRRQNPVLPKAVHGVGRAHGHGLSNAEFVEKLKAIRVLFRAPDTMGLWGIPYDLREGQAPRDLWMPTHHYAGAHAGHHAGKDHLGGAREDWIWLGSPGWWGNLTPAHRSYVEAFLKAHRADVPMGPYEWSTVTPTDFERSHDRAGERSTHHGQHKACDACGAYRMARDGGRRANPGHKYTYEFSQRGMNKNGLTWPRWLAAAGVEEKSLWDDGQQQRRAALYAAWLYGEDPTDYRAAAQRGHGRRENPLLPGCSRDVVSENIRREAHAGRPHKQAVAIALSNRDRQGCSDRQSNPAEGPHLREGYAFRLEEGANWKSSPSDLWDQDIVDDSDMKHATFQGTRFIDGTRCHVFRVGSAKDPAYLAQVALGTR